MTKKSKYTELTFQLIVESTPNAIVLINKEGKIAYVNGQTEKLFGYSRTEFIGQSVEKLIPKRFHGKHPTYRKEFFTSPSVRAMGVGRELFALRKDGSEFPIEIGLNPLVTVDGTLVLASIIDITERKKAEERFRLVVNSSPNAMILVNENGKISLVNNEAKRLFEYEESDLVGNKLEILIPKRFRGEHTGFRDMFFKKPQTRAMGAGSELYAVTKNDREIPVEIGLNPIETEDGMMVLASIVDITERKKEEERFRLVVNSAPNAMILVTEQGDISLINNETKKLFGYEEYELIGNKLEILIPERFRNKHIGFRDMFFEKPQTRSMGVGRDLFAVRKDNREIPVEIGLNPIETEEGTMVLASIVDITERKRQESAIKRQLELEVKNKELEQFAYIASHDLQEPLRTVSNFSLALLEDYNDQLDEDAKKYLNSITRATNRMKALVKALLNFSRLGRNRQLNLVDCSKIIENTIADLDDTIKTTGAIIEVGEMPSLNLCETEIRQLFQNLISNAIKFRKKNIPPKIQINSEKSENKWKFSVKDNGIGIEQKHFERIFFIFQQLHNTKEYEGYGIGLPNCKKIVELHDGEIGLKSVFGEGSTFYFTISTLNHEK